LPGNYTRWVVQYDRFLREAASRGPSVLADILVPTGKCVNGVNALGAFSVLVLKVLTATLHSRACLKHHLKPMGSMAVLDNIGLSRTLTLLLNCGTPIGS